MENQKKSFSKTKTDETSSKNKTAPLEISVSDKNSTSTKQSADLKTPVDNKAPLKSASSIKIKKCTLAQLDELQKICCQTFSETFASSNSQSDMEKFLNSAYSKEKLREELLNPESQTFLAFEDEPETQTAPLEISVENKISTSSESKLANLETSVDDKIETSLKKQIAPLKIPVNSKIKTSTEKSATLKTPVDNKIKTKSEKVLGFLKINFGNAQTEQKCENSLEIQRIYVLKTAKGRGIGSSFMSLAQEIAREKNLSCIWLGVWEHNEKAKEFYAKKGFYKFGEHIFTLGSDQQIDFLMKKDLKTVIE